MNGDDLTGDELIVERKADRGIRHDVEDRRRTVTPPALRYLNAFGAACIFAPTPAASAQSPVDAALCCGAVIRYSLGGAAAEESVVIGYREGQLWRALLAPTPEQAVAFSGAVHRLAPSLLGQRVVVPGWGERYIVPCAIPLLQGLGGAIEHTGLSIHIESMTG
jgi:hypothetical protein